jgi:hypothetical protein
LQQLILHRAQEEKTGNYEETRSHTQQPKKSILEKDEEEDENGGKT